MRKRIPLLVILSAASASSTVKFCDPGTALSGCASSSYNQVYPELIFGLRLECDSCGDDADHEIKLVDVRGSCTRDAADPSLEFVNGISHGGSLPTPKVWEQLRIRAVQRSFSLCYCDNLCRVSSNWRKVGEIPLASGLRAANSVSDMLLPFAMVAGSVGLCAGVYNPSQGGYTSTKIYDGPSFSTNGLFNILPFDFLTTSDYNGYSNELLEAQESVGGKLNLLDVDFRFHTDKLQAACRSNPPDLYRTDLLSAPVSRQDAAENYFSSVPTSTLQNLHSFGGGSGNRLYMKKAGVVAVCLCGELNGAGYCDSISGIEPWMFASLITIPGPRTGHVFTSYTNAGSTLVIRGWGFDGTEKIRLVPSYLSCGDDPENSPNLLSCVSYGSCSEVHETAGHFSGHLADTSQLTVTNVHVDSDHSVLTFDSDISTFLFDGDEISLTSTNVYVDLPERLAGRQLLPDGTVRLAPLRIKVLNTTHVSIPVAPVDFDPTNLPDLKVTKHNELHVPGVSSSIYLKLKVCMGRRIGGRNIFNADAGLLTIKMPLPITNAKVHVVDQIDITQPAVLSFTMPYEVPLFDAVSYLVLKILDVTRFQLMQSLEEEEISTLPDSRMSCGQIFTDFSMNFPSASSCFVTETFRDVDKDGNLHSNLLQEIVIIFPKYMYFNAKEDYALTLRAQFKNILPDEELIQVDLRCEDCGIGPLLHGRGFGAVAGRGVAVSSSHVLSSRALTGYGVPYLTMEGEHTNQRETNNLEVFVIDKNKKSIEVKVWGTIDGILRVYMYPLAQWNLLNCTVSEESLPEDVSCSLEKFGITSNVMVVKIYDDEEYDLPFKHYVFEFETAENGFPGFMKTYMAASISDEKTSKFGTRSYIKMQTWRPSTDYFSVDYSPDSISSGQLFLPEKAVEGGPRPFPSQQDNPVIVLFSIGSTLVYPASFEIVAPSGYILRLDANYSTNQKTWPDKSYSPYLFLDEMGELSCAYNICTYTLKNKNSVLFANWKSTVPLLLQNPSEPLLTPDEGNVWKISNIETDGETVYPTIDFTNDENSLDIRANLPVIHTITENMITPFLRTGGTGNTIIRFVLNSNVGHNAKIVISTPTNVLLKCPSTNFEDYIYSRPSKGVEQLWPLLTKSCFEQTHPLHENKQFVVEVDNLMAGRQYKFQVESTILSNADLQPWIIWIHDEFGNVVESTPYTGMHYEFADAAYAHKDELNVVMNYHQARIPSTTVNTSIQIKFPLDRYVTGLEIFAPLGYIFLTTFHVCTFCVPKILQTGNQTIRSHISWQNQEFEAGELFIYNLSIKLPENVDALTSHAFLFRAGLNTAVPFVKLYDALPINEIFDGFLHYSDSRVQAENKVDVEFSLRNAGGETEKYAVDLYGNLLPNSVLTLTISGLLAPVTASILLIGMLVNCDASTVVADSTVTCTVPQDFVVGERYERGEFKSYRITVFGTNSQTRAMTSFEVGLQNAFGDSKGRFALDGFVPVPSFRVSHFVSLTNEQKEAFGRNDRPERENMILLSFEISDVVDPTFLKVVAPEGFIFSPECSDGLEVARTDLIREVGEFNAWGSRPISCVGNKNVALLELNSNTILPFLLYAIQMKVTNAFYSPAHNYWSLEVDSQASAPFEGFPLWTLQNATMLPATTALSEDTPTVNYIHLTFSPYSRIPQNGTLTILPPDGFVPTCDELVFRHDGHGYEWHEGQDIFCSQDNIQEVRLEFNRSVTANEQHSLFVKVTNPHFELAEGSQKWRFRTYSETFFNDTYLLDEIRLPTFPIYPRSPIFNITVPDIRGNTSTLATINIGLPLPLQLNDIIEIDFAKGAQIFEGCRNFLLHGMTEDISDRVPTECICAGSDGYDYVCTIFINVTEYVKVVANHLQEDSHTGASLQFELDVVNAINPGINEMADRMFTIYHKRDKQILSSRSTLGYDVRPQLADVGPIAGKTVLVGPNVRAGSRSTIGFFFTPLNDAEAIRVEIVSPGFDFRDLVIQYPEEASIDKSNITSNVIVVEDTYRTHVQAWLVLTNVQLGFYGDAILHLQTYATKEKALEEKREDVVDEKLHYLAWRQSAAASLTNAILEPSSNSNGGSTAASLNLAPRCETHLSFKSDLVLPLGGDVDTYFLFDCTTFIDTTRLLSSGNDLHQENQDVQVPSTCSFLPDAYISFDNVSYELVSNVVKLTSPLPAHTLITMIVDGLIVEDCGMVESLPYVKMRAETWRQNENLPMQSNDGEQVIESLRATLQVQLHASAVPPDSDFEMSVSVSTQVGKVLLSRELTKKQQEENENIGLEMWLVAADGFTFVIDDDNFCGLRCKVEEDVTPCGGAFSDRQKARLLPLVDNSYNENASPINFIRDQFFMNVHSPGSIEAEDEKSNWWVLTCPKNVADAPSNERDAVVGWGLVDTIPVRPMPTFLSVEELDSNIYLITISFHLRFPVLSDTIATLRALPAVKIKSATNNINIRCPENEEEHVHPQSTRPVCTTTNNTLLSPVLSKVGLLTNVWENGSLEPGDYFTNIIFQKNVTDDNSSLDADDDEIKIDISVVSLPSEKVVDGVFDLLVPMPGQLGSLSSTMVTGGIVYSDILSRQGDDVLVDVTLAFFVNDTTPIHANAVLITAPMGVTFLSDDNYITATSLASRQVANNSIEERVLPGDSHLRMRLQEGSKIPSGIHRYSVSCLIKPTIENVDIEWLRQTNKWWVSICSDGSCRSPVDGPAHILAALGPLDGIGPGDERIIQAYEEDSTDGSHATNLPFHFVLITILFATAII